MVTKEEEEKYGLFAQFLEDDYDKYVYDSSKDTRSGAERIIDNAKCVKRTLYESGKVLGEHGQILDFDFIISLLDSIVDYAEDIEDSKNVEESFEDKFNRIADKKHKG